MEAVVGDSGGRPPAASGTPVGDPACGGVPASVAARATPGSIIQVAGGMVTVATGEGTLEIREVQPAGRRRMAGKEFLAGHKLTVGEQLGDMRHET